MRCVWIFVLAGDALCVLTGLGFAYLLRFRTGLLPLPNLVGYRPEDANYVVLLGAGVGLSLLALAAYRLYEPRRLLLRLLAVRDVFHAVLVAMVGTTGLAFFLKMQPARTWPVLGGIATFLLLTGWRVVVGRWLARLRVEGIVSGRVLIVGADSGARVLAERLERREAGGYQVVGFMDDQTPVGCVIWGQGAVLGPVGDLAVKAERLRPDAVVVSSGAASSETVAGVLRTLEGTGVRVLVAPALADVLTSRLVVASIGDMPLLDVGEVRLSGPKALAKRALDLILATVGLVVLAPVFLAIAVAVLADGGRPVLFRHWRVGRFGKGFRVWKFRTMVLGAEEMEAGLAELNGADGPRFKVASDPRVTRVGEFLRRSSLDELPQLLNVLKGDMSLVGPRPMPLSEVAHYDELELRRLRAVPGMTGLWQVSGRSDLSFGESMRLDVLYVENWSPLLDLAILARTLPAVLSRRGAV